MKKRVEERKSLIKESRRRKRVAKERVLLREEDC